MKLFIFDAGSKNIRTSIALLLVRLTFGGMMLFGHGLNKLNIPKETISTWPKPFYISFLSEEAAYWLTVITEIGFAGLFILGFATRLVSSVMCLLMVTAAFIIHADHAFFSGPGISQSKELALVYLAGYLTILISGAGRFSIDGIKK